MRLQILTYGRSHHIQGIGLQAGLRTSDEDQIGFYRHHSDIRKLAFTHPLILVVGVPYSAYGVTAILTMTLWIGSGEIKGIWASSGKKMANAPPVTAIHASGLSAKNCMSAFGS